MNRPLSQFLALNHYLAKSGICSRRKAEQLIQSGKVIVNYQTQCDPGYRVTPTDIVQVDGKKIDIKPLLYLLLNKPKGYITTSSDERQRKTVMDLITSATNYPVHSVGRLDRDTTGLLLLTNDGALTQQLCHPRYGVEKVYRLRLDRPIKRVDIQQLRQGIHLDDGLVVFDALSVNNQDKKQLIVTLHSGKYRVIRRTFQALGYRVIALDRVCYAGLTKKGLKTGQWRFLTPIEIQALKKSK